MKKRISVLCIALALCITTLAGHSSPTSWIRINQLGYLPDAVKTAVFISSESSAVKSFELVDAASGKVVFKGKTLQENGAVWGMKTAARLDFSSVSQTGRFFLRSGETVSPSFSIAPEVYKGVASFILKYLRQQRCGFNPFLNDTCHQHDGFIVDHPTRSGEIIDVRGGWHDASDYLQYTTTSANAVYHLLFAYSRHPETYGDEFLASGLPGKNGIPDIIDEAVWGMEWLLKMNPAYGEMYNQIADDRDHAGMRLPVRDKTSYGNGIYRPVYYVTGKSQGLSKHKNRTTGVSSVAGKFASAFALGSEVLKPFYRDMAAKLKQKALDAYSFGLTDLGVTQTACFVSPYFYEEENWTDDLELAAAELFRMTGDEKYLKDAQTFGQTEPVTPWMSTNKARHYQFYPFLNLGHIHLASQKDSAIRAQFTGYLRDGLEAIRERADEDPFRMGIPFIWCSNNLVSAALMQAGLYQEITGDLTYREIEAALRDWLFGCNPWGTSMICGLPADGDSPVLPHSAYIMFLKENTLGGLVDGPVYASIYKSLIGIHLLNEDSYAAFQNGKAVYHDDIGDYSTNEPTMDGTASLSWYFSWLEKNGKQQTKKP